MLMATIAAWVFSAGLLQLHDGGSSHGGGDSNATEKDDFGLLQSADDSSGATGESDRDRNGGGEGKSLVEMRVQAGAAAKSSRLAGQSWAKSRSG